MLVIIVILVEIKGHLHVHVHVCVVWTIMNQNIRLHALNTTHLASMAFGVQWVGGCFFTFGNETEKTC